MVHLASGEGRLSLAVSSSVNLSALAITLLDSLELLANLLDARAARSGDVSSVTIVGVDANKVANVLSLDVGDDNVAGPAIVGAVATATVQLAGIDDGEVLDGHGSAAVVLDDLVLGLLGATTLDENVAISESRDGICEIISKKTGQANLSKVLTLADISEPDVLESASSLAVNTLKLASSNNDVAECGSVVEDEDSAVTASVGVSVTVAAAVVLAVSKVIDARERTGLRKRLDGADSGRDVESLAGNSASERESSEDGRVKHLEETGVFF